MKWVPAKYMKQAIRFGVSRGAAGLWLDPGMRKTSITLAIFKILREKKFVRGMLVVAPLRVAYSVWPGEASKWDEFQELSVGVLHGMEKVQTLWDPHDVYVINPEGLPWLFSVLDKITTWPFDMLVLDESTKFKNRDTQRFKLLAKYINRFKRRYTLTGTPAPKGLIDLFSQVFLLDGGTALGRYITHYRSRYFDQIPPLEYQIYVPKVGAENKIYKQLDGLILRMDAKDYLDLPPLSFNDIRVKFEGRVRDVYDDMQDKLLAYLDSGRVDAANAAVAVNKCLQLTGGGIYDDQKRVHEVHDIKVQALSDLVGELNGKPILVAYGFQHEIARIRAVLGERVPYIGGGVSAKRGRELEDQWNRGEIPILLAHPDSVAHGLNLQGAACHICFYSLTWDLENYDQMIKRLWRSGQTQRVVVHRIVAIDTVDEHVMSSLMSKDRVQRRLLDAIRDQTKRRFKQ